jgi:hypothetical protein
MMSEQSTTEQAGDWLVGTVRRNPEALLVLAAGCAMLMRSKSGRREAPRRDEPRDGGGYYGAAEQPRWQGNESRSGEARPGDGMADAAKDAAKRARDYTSDVTGRVSDAASEYAATASAYAGNVRESIVSGASRLPDQARSTVERGFAHILREQPLAIAAMGLAAGATLAAVFPATETESQVLRPARDAVMGAASRAAENVKSAAGEAGEHLKEAARERGLDAEGFKGLAREVAGAFADNVTGRQDQARSGERNQDAPGLVPGHTGS